MRMLTWLSPKNNWLYPDLQGRKRCVCLVVKREKSYSFIPHLGQSIQRERA